MITVGQIKAARAFLGLTQSQLAAKADISLATLNNAERGIVAPHRSTLKALQLALEDAGIEFLPENGGGPGVRLRNKI